LRTHIRSGVIMVEYLIVGIMALLVGIYLFAALLRPDWF
jgi:K+-transporting ATPase KdpF subunit